MKHNQKIISLCLGHRYNLNNITWDENAFINLPM